MKIIRDWRDCPREAYGSALALGNFDGVHLGHRAVIEAMKARAGHAPKAVMTFEPHPRRLFAPHLPPLRIVPFHEKARLLRELGVEYLFVQRFTRAFSQTSARDFLHEILLQGLRVFCIITGGDFIFGHNRQGCARYLADEAAQSGAFDFHCADMVAQGAEKCSSTAIRNYLERGEVAAAAAMLGRPYTIEGTVRRGDARGRTIGFPTANIVPGKLFLPATGVYAVRVSVLRGQQAERAVSPRNAASCDFQEKIPETILDGVANLGIRPTFGGEETRLEVHCFGEPGDLYERRLRVELLHHLRPERKFDGLGALKAQIAQDAQQAREFLAMV